MIMETIMEMVKEKEMVNINLKEALGSLFFYINFLNYVVGQNYIKFKKSL